MNLSVYLLVQNSVKNQKGRNNMSIYNRLYMLIGLGMAWAILPVVLIGTDILIIKICGIFVQFIGLSLMIGSGLYAWKRL